MAPDDGFITDHPVVSHEEWLAARRALLEKEKAFTRQGDEMSRLQRDLPWERVTKEYVFEGPTARRRSPISSPGAVSSSCITSCSIRTTRPVARTAHCAPTASPASVCT